MARFRIFSGVSKFSFIAILGLIVSLVEHLVGFSTNYWVVKEINVGVYYCQGLWRECYCHTYCACVYIDKYPEDASRMMIVRVLECLGLTSLLAAIVMLVIGVKTRKTGLKVSATVACFLSGAFIIAGVIGVAITFLSNVWDLHYSLILAAKSGGLILLSGCFLLADLITRGIDPNRGQDSDRSFSRNNKRSESSEHLKPKDKTNKSNERRLGDYVKSEQQKKNISISNQFSEINGYSNQIDYDETLSNGHVSVNTDDKNAQDDYGFESDVYRKKANKLNKESESDIKGYENNDFDRKYARYPRESYYDQISANLDNKSQDVPNGNDNHIGRNERLYGDNTPITPVINTHKQSYDKDSDYLNQPYADQYRGQLIQEIQQPIDFNVNENNASKHTNIRNTLVNKQDQYMFTSHEGDQSNTQTQEMEHLGQYYDKDYNNPYSTEPNPYLKQYNAGIGNTDNRDKHHQRERRRKQRGTGNTQRSNADYEADEYPKQREQSNCPRQLHTYETEQPYRQDEYPKQREQSISPRQLHTYETEQPYKQDADQLYVVLPETSQSIWPCSKSRSPEPFVTSQTGVSRRHTTETEV